MINIGWRLVGLVSNCCYCLIKFNICALNSILIFAKLFFFFQKKLKCFEIPQFRIFLSTLQLYIVYFFEWIVSMSEHFLELHLLTDTTLLVFVLELSNFVPVFEP